MELNFKPNIEKTINAILFILQHTEGRCGFHKAFKVLFFADQKHLATYGKPISGDQYIAMQNGPVPSRLYDILKFLRGDSYWRHVGDHDFHDYFEVQANHNIVAKRQPDMDVLAQSDVQCLSESIAENCNLSFGALTDKSHQSAWEKAKDNEMSPLDIALDGGATEEMIKYIQMSLENQNMRFSNAKPG